MKKSMIKKCTCLVAATLAVISGGFGLPAQKASADASLEGRYYDAHTVSTRAAGDYELIPFATKEHSLITTPNNVPYYYNTNFDNGCGAVGGAIIAGYYDKYYQNLIPDYTNYYPATGKYRPQDDDYVPALIQSMFTSMQTNVVAPGVSEAECLDGLEAYVEGKGYSISYTTVKAYNGSFNHTAYKNAINNGEPVLLFCDSVVLYSFTSGDTQDRTIVKEESQDHIVVGFGYQETKYYDANGNNFRTDIYLKVASGWYPNTMGYIKINDDSCLDSGYAVDIY